MFVFYRFHFLRWLRQIFLRPSNKKIRLLPSEQKRTLDFAVDMETATSARKLAPIVQVDDPHDVVINAIQLYDTLVTWHQDGEEMYARNRMTHRNTLCPLPVKPASRQISTPSDVVVTLSEDLIDRTQNLMARTKVGSIAEVAANAVYFCNMLVEWELAQMRLFRKSANGKYTLYNPFMPSSPNQPHLKKFPTSILQFPQAKP